MLKTRSELSDELKSRLYTAFIKLKHRGPDRSDFIEFDLLLPFFLGFHRLAVMDRSTNGDQPFVCEHQGRTIYTLCNGELYNYRKLIEKYKIPVTSNSDCEVIPYIYREYGIETLVDEIKDGEFAFTILDIHLENRTMTLYAGHDPTGVRPLFLGQDEHCVCFASELSSLVGIVDAASIQSFPPGSYIKMCFNIDSVTGNSSVSHQVCTYYDFDAIPPFKEPESLDVFEPGYLDQVCQKVRSTLEESVINQLAADRPLGALLSGGLDSSLVVGIAAKHLKATGGKKLRTFSIGMPGGTDGPFAQSVADYCGTEHTHFELSTEDFLGAIREVIHAIGSYDITTVRASVGQYLVVKKISEETDIKVLLIGDGSDELCSGYMYFHKAPTPEESHYENCRLLKEIGYFDVLRADRGVAHHGLEARCPFLSLSFIDLYLKLDCRLRVPIEGVEKWLLRRSFEGAGVLPEAVRLRPKCAFSDGVSKKERSWFEICGENAESLYTPEELAESKITYQHLPPITFESLYYRKTFDEFYPDTPHVIPHYWLPKFCGDINEPSARVLDVCRE